MGMWTDHLMKRWIGRGAPPREAPEKTCPWCGGAMRSGYLWAGGCNILWRPKRPNPGSPSTEPGPGEVEVGGEDGMMPCRTCWYCPACRRIAAELGEQPPVRAENE